MKQLNYLITGKLWLVKLVVQFNDKINTRILVILKESLL